jgi:hypothetical protein
MKKVILSMALATAVISANAQDMNSKRGTPILPEAKDWMIGIDAHPVLDYFGNLFNHDFNEAPDWNFTRNNSMIITGGCVKDETTMYRAKIRLGFGSNKQDSLYDNPFTTATDNVTDTRKTSSNDIAIGAGIQKNRGKGRLRGIYGAEAMIGLGGGKTTNDYGISLTDSTATGPRTTEEKEGSTFSFGVRAFIGAEYFFAPKMSLSGEFGWGLGLSSTGEGEVTTERRGIAPGATETSTITETTKTGKSSSFGIDTDNLGGSIVFHFYF